VTQLELDEQLQLHLLDATRDELRADLEAAGAAADWQRSGLYRALVQRSQDSGSAWTMIACDLAFDASAADVALLAALGAVGAFCGAPLLGAARPALLGRSSFGAPSEPAPLGTEDAARWQALRTSALAPWLGLAAPRMLMRQPYGRRSDPIDRFDFEELGATPLPAQWLWGPPAFAVALLAARAFAAAGWDGDPNDDREIGDLPAATVEHDGERELQPCAEGWLGDAAAQAMLDAGVMPLVAARHRNAVQVRRVQSIADPPCALAGR
jgi:type VI secretion system ImpC/EvpB family protein